MMEEMIGISTNASLVLMYGGFGLSGTKLRNNGEWTEARFRSFIKGGLRSVSVRWPPRYKCRSLLWVVMAVVICLRKVTQEPVSHRPHRPDEALQKQPRH